MESNITKTLFSRKCPAMHMILGRKSFLLRNLKYHTVHCLLAPRVVVENGEAILILSLDM